MSHKGKVIQISNMLVLFAVIKGLKGNCKGILIETVPLNAAGGSRSSLLLLILVLLF